MGRHLEATGIKDATAARKLTAVPSFHAWRVRRSHVKPNPDGSLVLQPLPLAVDRIQGEYEIAKITARSRCTSRWTKASPRS